MLLSYRFEYIKILKMTADTIHELNIGNYQFCTVETHRKTNALLTLIVY